MRIHSFALRSFTQNRSFVKSDREQIALVALYIQKSDESELLSSFFKKKSKMRDSPVILSFALKKRAIRSKKILAFTKFLTVFHCFSPYYSQEGLAPVVLYKKATMSDFLPVLFKIEQNSDSLFGKEHITNSLFRSQKKTASGSLRNQRAKFPTLSMPAKKRRPIVAKDQCQS